jgi:hypothetical protein
MEGTGYYIPIQAVTAAFSKFGLRPSDRYPRSTRMRSRDWGYPTPGKLRRDQSSTELGMLKGPGV